MNSVPMLYEADNLFLQLELFQDHEQGWFSSLVFTKLEKDDQPVSTVVSSFLSHRHPMEIIKKAEKFAESFGFYLITEDVNFNFWDDNEEASYATTQAIDLDILRNPDEHFIPGALIEYLRAGGRNEDITEYLSLYETFILTEDWKNIDGIDTNELGYEHFRHMLTERELDDEEIGQILFACEEFERNKHLYVWLN